MSDGLRNFSDEELRDELKAREDARKPDRLLEQIALALQEIIQYGEDAGVSAMFDGESPLNFVISQHDDAVRVLLREGVPPVILLPLADGRIVGATIAFVMPEG